MIDEDKVSGDNPGKKHSEFTDNLIQKGKELADKAEDFIEGKVSQVKESETFGKISGLVEKVGNYMEEQSEAFHSGEMEAKIDELKNKAEEKSDELLTKARNAGLKIGDQVDKALDALKGKKG